MRRTPRRSPAPRSSSSASPSSKPRSPRPAPRPRRPALLRRLDHLLSRAKSEADRLQREILSKDRQLDVLQRQGVVSAPRGDLSRAAEEAFERETAAAAVSSAPGIAAAPRTYKVRRGDALWSIAQKAYGDASRMADIRAANRDVLGGSDRLVEGMILTLPPY